jgi:hypothetical protein|eukprot:scaffold1388_cov267-Chaetoceros_neogracile.AAC.55
MRVNEIEIWACHYELYFRSRATALDTVKLVLEQNHDDPLEHRSLEHKMILLRVLKARSTKKVQCSLFRQPIVSSSYKKTVHLAIMRDELKYRPSILSRCYHQEG